jgi:hypothetical protein
MESYFLNAVGDILKAPTWVSPRVFIILVIVLMAGVSVLNCS